MDEDRLEIFSDYINNIDVELPDIPGIDKVMSQFAILNCYLAVRAATLKAIFYVSAFAPPEVVQDAITSLGDMDKAFVAFFEDNYAE